MEDRFAAARKKIEETVLRGPGKTAPELRQAVCDRKEVPEELRALVAEIGRKGYTVTDEEIAALRAKYGEDELWELVVSAALGAALVQLRAGMRALEEA